MKRKVNKVGQNTLTVSLPKKWTNQYGIKKGDELHLDLKGSSLEICTEKQSVGREVTVKADGLDATSFQTILRYNYRHGATIIKVQFSNPNLYDYRRKEEVSVMQVVNKEVPHLIGMEVIEQTDSFCLLKTMVKEDKREFDDFFRRIFFIIIESYGFLADYTTTKKGLSRVQEHHDSLTRFVSYCTRLLNKFGHEEPHKAALFLSMLEDLENIMDVLEHVALNIITFNMDVTEKSKPLLLEMQTFFERFVECYYAFERKKATALNKRRVEIVNEIGNKKNLLSDDKAILHELSTVFLVVRLFIGQELVLRQ